MASSPGLAAPLPPLTFQPASVDRRPAIAEHRDEPRLDARKGTPMPTVTLRELTDDDRAVLFEFQKDPESIQMAAFTSADPSDAAAYNEWWSRVMTNDAITKRAILADGALVGSILSFPLEGRLEVSYGISRGEWGKGIGTAALRLFLEIVDTRPIYAHVATDNLGSLRVLEKCGFVICGTERGFANARGEEIDEYLLGKTEESMRESE